MRAMSLVRVGATGVAAAGCTLDMGRWHEAAVEESETVVEVVRLKSGGRKVKERNVAR